jgi:PadR family transcriptional regulator AphA
MSTRSDGTDLLLGEWACLGVLATGPAHGFAVAARLRPEGDVGRVWSLSRPLTYRSLDQLGRRGLVRAVAEEHGVAGGSRTILAITRSGRTRFGTWVTSPTAHLRDVRSELLLKLVLGEQSGIDLGPMLIAQRSLVAEMTARLDARSLAGGDVVSRWRVEHAHAVLRFLDAIIEA